MKIYFRLDLKKSNSTDQNKLSVMNQGSVIL